ncbi:MAG: hypothetical protein QOG01_4761, partial [Pseudonocardiales bacterium]|nr:hypothetical protein [Pseudonocardiales bacterium]
MTSAVSVTNVGTGRRGQPVVAGSGRHHSFGFWVAA